MKDKIIITAPLPPPIHGMSLATKMLIDGISDRYDLTVVDTSMDKGTLAFKQPSLFAPKRFLKAIGRLFSESFTMLTTSYDLHYLCVGSDFRGIMRYFPTVLISKIKRKPYVIHNHNGAFGQTYASLSGVKKQLIDWIFRDAAAVIALGDTLQAMFLGAAKPENICVVENCVDDEFFATPEQIQQKKSVEKKVTKVLFLSNLMEDKGIFELMEAVSQIENCELHIAGAVENKESSQIRVDDYLAKYKDQFFYYGVVKGEQKEQLLLECDIFVLPTRFDEGQPISILEAYANGLAVVTDPSYGGIRDIFTDGVNGCGCVSCDPNSIKEAIEKCRGRLGDFIEPNYDYATSKFKRSDYVQRMSDLFTKVVHKKRY